MSVTKPFSVLSEQPNLRDLCPKDIAIDPKYVWTYGSVCLQLSMDKHDWPHARERCQRHGGDLVQIRTADMQGSIIEKIRQSHSHIKTGFWIGASDQHHEGLWQWVSGQLDTCPFAFLMIRNTSTSCIREICAKFISKRHINVNNTAYLLFRF